MPISNDRMNEIAVSLFAKKNWVHCDLNLIFGHVILPVGQYNRAQLKVEIFSFHLMYVVPLSERGTLNSYFRGLSSHFLQYY